MRRRQRLSIEYAGCFFIVPLLLLPFSIKGVYVWLWMAALLCMWWLHKHARWSPKKDWKAHQIKPILPRILKRFAVLAVPMVFFTYLYIPDRFFELPRNNPIGWLGIMIAYPIVSVIPQEILFRSFLHRRYRWFFQSRRAIIIASAVTFGWAHIVMNNWVAVVFSFIGGLMFADTFCRTKSLAAVVFEHALYGCFVFTIGLGWYFYHAGAGH